MIVFFSHETESIIITPFRCGSRHLIKNASDYNLMHFSVETAYGKKLFKSIINDVEDKTFLYRDPVDRYISFYHTFIFNKPEKEAPNKSIIPKIRSKNFWEDLYNSVSLLEKYFDIDSHTNNQYRYFSMMDENINDYKIIDVENFSKFIYLTFADKVEAHKKPLSDEKFNFYDFQYYNKIKPRLEKLYEEDVAMKSLVQEI